MKIRLLIINLVCILGTLWAQEKTFYLKSGDKVTGTITAETDSTYGIETTFGSVTINKNDVDIATEVVAEKVPVKKSLTKKSPAKKAATKKTTTKKAATKKTTTKKVAAKKD